jgi:hypothetical protein
MPGVSRVVRRTLASVSLTSPMTLPGLHWPLLDHQTETAGG